MCLLSAKHLGDCRHSDGQVTVCMNCTCIAEMRYCVAVASPMSKASYDSYSSNLLVDIVFPFVCLFIHSFYQYTLWYMRMKCFEICKDDRQPARYADGTKMLFTIAYLKWSCQSILIVWYTLLSRIQTVSRCLLINLYLHYKPIRHCITISL